MIGKTVSHYEILDKLGGGGMGVVFKARDLKLDRFVALKFLPRHLVSVEAESDRLLRERFALEAKASSALDHANIGVIHEIGETEDGETFIAMAYYEGETLRERIARGPLALEDAISIAEQIARGLTKAHEHGIVHRDIKPANVIVTRDGGVKIIDFGLAKLQEVTRMTRRGDVMGTPVYMSPEQARGEDVDARTDIWSLGVVLYEMLTGQVPFRGAHESAVIHSILHDPPRPARELRADLPTGLERVLFRALEKDRGKRFGSAMELVEGLKPHAGGPDPPGARTRPWKKVSVAVLALLLVLAGAWFFHRAGKVRWARERALPDILRLVGEGDYWTAFSLAREAERYIPKDPILTRSMPELSTHLTIETTPPGVEVYFKRYEAVEDDWEHLGRTPIVQKRVPHGFYRWRLTKDGFQTLEQARSSSSVWWQPFGGDTSIRWSLDPEGVAPPGMVKVTGGAWYPTISGLDHQPEVEIGDYWVDRYEVTNEQFQAFVDRGGYQERLFWKEPFLRERELDWDEAMLEFRDATGRPGPSTWELGTYPAGQEDDPVSGVSWYEAAAYAEFAGKELPTVYHWSEAAGTRASSYVVSVSNVEGRSRGPQPAGSSPAISRFGAYDMAGNVREWCRNEGGDGKRYILGGAWNEPSYMFLDNDAQSPWDRSAINGFRTVKRLSSSPLPAAATGRLLSVFRDYSEEKPVPDDVFAIYRSLYAYDKTPLNAVVESVDDVHDSWRREKVTFDAPYGNERITAYLFVPKKTTPPYQTVLFFPASNAITSRSFLEYDMRRVDFLVASGRAVMFPVYKGTFERAGDLKSDRPSETTLFRDHVLAWAKEVGRSIDYLETRDDIDESKIAYYGLSWGATLVQIPAVEHRLKTVVLVGGGMLFSRALPEVEQIHFAPRVTAPVLMINGRSDFFFPVETSQEPLHRLLGTPEKDKRSVRFDSGHVPPRNEVIKETLEWLDRYLGPVP